MMLYTLLLLSNHIVAFRPPQRLLRRAPPRHATTTTDVKVYIESTDCFKVTFYANYFKWLEYGLGKRLRAVDGMAYRRPAVLGDQLTVHTTPFEDGSSNHAQTIERDGVQLMTVRRTSDEEVTRARRRPDLRQGAIEYAAHVPPRRSRGRDGGLSLDSCLRAFERSRSTFLADRTTAYWRTDPSSSRASTA